MVLCTFALRSNGVCSRRCWIPHGVSISSERLYLKVLLQLRLCCVYAVFFSTQHRRKPIFNCVYAAFMLRMCCACVISTIWTCSIFLRHFYNCVCAASVLGRKNAAQTQHRRNCKSTLNLSFHTMIASFELRVHSNRFAPVGASRPRNSVT
jgi:hypothetical protein